MRFPSYDSGEKPSSAAAEEPVRLTASESEDGSWKALPPHAEEGQVELDVARAFVYYPECEYTQHLHASHHGAVRTRPPR